MASSNNLAKSNNLANPNKLAKSNNLAGPNHLENPSGQKCPWRACWAKDTRAQMPRGTNIACIFSFPILFLHIPRVPRCGAAPTGPLHSFLSKALKGRLRVSIILE